MFIGSNCAGDKWTRTSRTGFIIYRNTSLINWYSKRQFTIETSVFGVEFVAMKVSVETLCAIILISRASYIYGDNVLVIHNTSTTESTLKKKCNVIAYHAIHEFVAMGENLTRQIRSEDNIADLLSKVVTGFKRKHLAFLVLYDIHDGDI